MLELFSTTPRKNGGRLIPPEMNYLKRNILVQTKKIHEYYNDHYKRIDATNLIVRLLGCYAMHRNLNDIDYAGYVGDMFSTYARTLGIVTPYNKAKVHVGGIFLGPKTEEIIQLTEDDENFFTASDTWRDLVPIRYRYHTRFETGYPILNNTTKGYGVGILELDIRKLMVKYRHWCEWQRGLTGQIGSKAYFVGTQVVPMMLESYMDIAMFNRLDRQQKDLPLYKYPLPHPIQVVDYTDTIDKVNTYFIEKSKGQHWNMEQVLYNIPMLFCDSGLSLVQPIRGYRNRNTDWVYILQILPFLRFLIRTETVGQINQGFKNQLLIYLRGECNYHLFSGLGSSKAIYYGLQQINELIEILSA